MYVGANYTRVNTVFSTKLFSESQLTKVDVRRIVQHVENAGKLGFRIHHQPIVALLREIQCVSEMNTRLACKVSKCVCMQRENSFHCFWGGQNEDFLLEMFRALCAAEAQHLKGIHENRSHSKTNTHQTQACNMS